MLCATSFRGSFIASGCGLFAALIAPPSHAADATAGQTVFANQCSACHTLKPGEHGFGPSLAGVVGRKAGTVAGYNFTDAMKHSGITWDAPTLESFLAGSTQKVPGTAMSVSVPSATDRADVVAYLATVSGPAPAAAAATAAPLLDGPTQRELNAAARDRQNWLYASKDYSGTRFADLRQITPANAKSLRPVCIYRSNFAGATQTNPLVYRGVMYLTVDRTVVAIDATTCRERWTASWDFKSQPLSPANRGVAIKDGRLVRGTADGYLVAYSMSDGAPLWNRKIGGPETSQYMSMPPLIFEDLVIYGPAGADWGAKNWIGAFKLATGEPVWRFNLVPDDNEPGADSWKNPQSRQHGGGSLWTPLSFDAAKGIVYVPVGNPAPDFYGDARPGDNLYTNSVVALDVRSGKMLWYKQFGPADVHDWDLSQTSPIFDANVHGTQRSLMAVAGKDGLLRMLDRNTREQLYEVSITTRDNVSAKPTEAGVHICPGLLGGLEWNGPAYDPGSNTLYVSTVNWCGTFTLESKPPQFALNAHYYGGAVKPDPRDKSRGFLQALNAADGSVRWRREWPTPLVAAIAATSGGMLFTGDLNNDFHAIDAKTGQTLYSFNTGGTLGGGVITYEHGGKQYVAAMSGVVSGFFGGYGTSAVVIFALP
jgi:alcohol dehydrogenase (cytochrome c)